MSSYMPLSTTISCTVRGATPPLLVKENMEPVGAMSEAEWSSLSGTCPTEEADFMAQLFGSCPNEQPSSSNVGHPIFWTSHDQSSMNMGSGTSQVSMYNSSDETNNSMYIFSQGISNSDGSSILYPPPSHGSYYPSNFQQNFLTNNTSMTMELSNRVEDKISSPSDQVAASNVIEADHAINFLNQEVSNDSMESGENMLETAHHGKSLQLGREYEMQVPEKCSQDREDSPSESSKKRSRLPVDIPKNKRSTKPKKNMKTADDNGKENNNVLHRQSSFSCCSEDESNFSYDLNGLTSSSNSKGKSRASRGSATDPQSLYARKRRERINERLRILQNLVPNGTKVDISTMLEEAVQYVKFLQLQIKLLSSDDLWMYSPIAYNGMDLGLDLKLGAPNS